ncbi:ATP-binding protein [Maribacter antarcticus]|uniref:ATP-binding protein n=1 Tax=Maribacter antarcticus TaxID=505250 RepID=UPI000A067D78|nr:ATP-binding protein [Maribacter antarcticus]
MKLTTKIKEDIKQALSTYWKSYLIGDLSTWAGYLADNYHNIGTTEEEIWTSKEQVWAYSKKVVHQLTGGAEFRDRVLDYMVYAPYVMVHEYGDIYVQTGDTWAFYGKIRLSSLLQQQSGQWQILHQHGSYPDNKTVQGETFAFKKISQENLALKDAIKRRTYELEQKNRELEVEGALERIRAQAVAMQQTSDLLDIVVTMRNEFIKLGHEAHYFWHMMWLPKTYQKAMTSGDGTKIGFVMELPRHIHGDIPLLANWEKSDDPVVIYPMAVDAAIDYVEKMITLGDFQHIDPQAPSNDDIRRIGGLTFIMARTTHGEIGYSLPGVVKKPPKEDLAILERFADAFDLAHRRFLDLQKAEKQAREVQIELALEKVRSRTMAMQHSDELQEASFLLDQQVRALGIRTRGCAFNIYGENDATEWFSSAQGTMPVYCTPRENVFLEYYEAGKRGESLYIKEFEGDACASHYDYLCTLPVMGKALRELKANGGSFPERQIDHATFFKYGYLLFITLDFVPDAHDIFKRFAKVFEQTYTRFLDLQKAEAQTREAQIEATLEKVRSRSLAMHKSHELKEVVAIIFEKLKELQIPATAVGIGIYIDGSKDLNAFVCGENKEGLVITNYHLPYFNNQISRDISNMREKQLDFFVGHYTKEEKDFFYSYVIDNVPEFISLPEDIKQMIFDSPSYTVSTVVVHNAVFSVNDFEGKVLSDREIDIFKRFARVFDQAYTRFLDLEKAEAQAREAQIEMALEKVRSRTMAMQHSDELHQAAKVLFSEIQALGIPSWSCGYNLLSDDNTTAQSWMSTQGNMQEVFTLEFKKEASFLEMYTFFESDDSFLVQELGDKNLESHYAYMRTIPSLGPSFEEIKQGGMQLPSYQINHLCKFNKGYLLFITFEKIPEAYDIFKRFTTVFEQTYTRFNDLKLAEANAEKAEFDLLKLQAAKKSAEEALSELLLTQTQLIQSEKMASLGELTAGIAHEIQNPLNFVNNFSEVSKELLEEMLEELENGDMEEVKAIMTDVVQNLEIINHHGNRADSIVKGMLQHSRSSTGKKEPTDINALADEYLRLAYHGLRAKDKSFNADMKADFDDSIKTITIIPQDIGRVVLNLVTNAFYTVNEKAIAAKVSGDTTYKPLVSIATKKNKNSVEIIVSDNGNGIPNKVIDKIFQPFFTTKPTGQGTGLGLSMSYDIVTKGHGGELNVSTKNGEGTEFSITLPPLDRQQ